jgi:hypothetical protein
VCVRFSVAISNTDISCTQCKEKFGGLRFYLNFCDDYASGVVDMAEAISTATCEICGKPGTRYKGGWISTLCNEHRSDEKLSEPGVSLVNGIGLGWSRLLVLLQEKADWDTEHNNRPKTTFNFSKVDNQLHIAYSGGNDETQGMVDFVIHYAQRIDEHSGFPVQQ